MSDEVNDFLSGGGAPSAKFPTQGTTVKGTVLFSEVSVQTDIDGNAKFFSDGSERKQLVVTLQTDEFDDEIPNDDGSRRVFMKGQMLKALKDNLRKQGVEFAERGRLTVVFASEEPSEKKGYNATKIFDVAYEAPVGVSSAQQELLGSDETPF